MCMTDRVIYMKREHYRDYAIEAFRFYARTGKTVDQLRDEMLEDPVNKAEYELRGGDISKPTEYELLHIQEMLGHREGELLDLIAVEKTLNQLQQLEREAVNMVYMKDATMKIERGDIQNRVSIASVNIGASESQIYRFLRKARNVFCLERKLRF